MNVRPVPARGGVAGKTSVNQRQEYIPDSKERAKKRWVAAAAFVEATCNIFLTAGKT